MRPNLSYFSSVLLLFSDLLGIARVAMAIISIEHVVQKMRFAATKVLLTLSKGLPVQAFQFRIVSIH